jgi:hypothetical protein
MRGYDKRLIAAAPAEQTKGLPEYADHASEIQAALADARIRQGGKK